jgi:hypothetical protein
MTKILRMTEELLNGLNYETVKEEARRRAEKIRQEFTADRSFSSDLMPK